MAFLMFPNWILASQHPLNHQGEGGSRDLITRDLVTRIWPNDLIIRICLSGLIIRICLNGLHRI
jgi:hypothetical protein